MVWGGVCTYMWELFRIPVYLAASECEMSCGKSFLLLVFVTLHVR